MSMTRTPPLRRFHVRYRLQDGADARLEALARSSCDVVDMMLVRFGLALARLQVRPA